MKSKLDGIPLKHVFAVVDRGSYNGTRLKGDSLKEPGDA